MVVMLAADERGHQVCVVYDTSTQATGSFNRIASAYGTTGGAFELTGDWQLPPVDAAEWHELKVVASDGSYWILFDNALVGSFTHDAPTTGTVSFSGANLGDTGSDTQIEFTDLPVRALQQ